MKTFLCIAALALMIYVGVTAFQGTNPLFNRHTEKSQALSEARAGIDRMFQELSRIQIGAWKISSPTPLTPYARIDFRRFQDVSDSAVFRQSHAVYLSLPGESPVPLFTNVSQFTVTADMNDLSILRVTLAIDIPTPAGPPETYRISNREIRLGKELTTNAPE